MTVETLMERIANAETKIGKKMNTISKKTAQIAKKKAEMVKKYGIDPETFDQWGHEFEEQTMITIRMTFGDIHWLEEDIKRLRNEVTETENTLSKYQEQLEKEQKNVKIFETEIPEAMKQMEIELTEEWDRWDKLRRERLRKAYKELGYEEFMKRWHYSDYQYRTISDAEIHASNVRDAHAEVLDLYNRVKKATGEVTSWDNIRLTDGNGFPVLNGYVEGKEGRCRVESILAGGYNIQRLHIRTLVKEY